MKYGVIEDDGEYEKDGEEADFDYIVVSDPETVRRLREMGVTGLATRMMEEAEEWEMKHGPEN